MSAPTVDIAHLSSCKLPLIERSAEALYRIHRTDFDPVYFGPSDGIPPTSRFDDPRSEFRVCYLGLSRFAVVAETLLHSPLRRVLNTADIERRSFATLRLVRTVKLVQLHGPGLHRLKITSDIVDHEDYAACGELIRALYERGEPVDGIEYRCRHDNDEIAVALFDRAADAIELESTIPIRRNDPLVVDVIIRYEIGLT